MCVRVRETDANATVQRALRLNRTTLMTTTTVTTLAFEFGMMMFSGE